MKKLLHALTVFGGVLPPSTLSANARADTRQELLSTEVSSRLGNCPMTALNDNSPIDTEKLVDEFLRAVERYRDDRRN
jgi:hypothetical protein